jgi:hypothetical protein
MKYRDSIDVGFRDPGRNNVVLGQLRQPVPAFGRPTRGGQR